MKEGQELLLRVRWTPDLRQCQCQLLPESLIKPSPPLNPPLKAPEAFKGFTVEPFECLYLDELAIPLLCDVPLEGLEASRELYELPEGFEVPPKLLKRRDCVVRSCHDDYVALQRSERRLDFFRKAFEQLKQRSRVLDLGAGCGQLSVMAAEVMKAEAHEDMKEDVIKK